MIRFYTLADGKPVAEPDPLLWAEWMHSADRCVEQTTRLVDGENVIISTMFLGLDHQYGNGPALLWETMIFGGRHELWQKRYSTLGAAKNGHAEAVDLVGGERAGLTGDKCLE